MTQPDPAAGPPPGEGPARVRVRAEPVLLDGGQTRLAAETAAFAELALERALALRPPG